MESLKKLINPEEDRKGGTEKQNWEGTGKLVDQNKTVSITTLHRLLYLNVIDHQTEFEKQNSEMQRCGQQSRVGRSWAYLLPYMCAKSL